jgi:MoxR-like ATPase
MRLNDARFGDRDISDIEQYIKLGKLGEAFDSEEQMVLLIDEIDKADIEFPNDLLNELDEMSFYIVETGRQIKAKHRPIVIITSNAEKELPDAFLRRCVFHYIEFPGKKLMKEIVKVHYPDIQDKLVNQVLEKFYQLRSLNYLRKKPSTSELIDWIAVLLKAGIKKGDIEDKIPFVGSLIKKEQDMAEFTKKKFSTQTSRGYYY